MSPREESVKTIGGGSSVASRRWRSAVNENFEMIQMLKCTPNSNFKMEAEFENVHLSKVVEFEKLRNFHFLRFSTSLEILGVICKMDSVAIL